jgi:hypothetical protein
MGLLAAMLLIILAACQPGQTPVSKIPTITPLDPDATPGVDRPLRIMPMGGSIVEGYCDRPSQCTWPDDYKGPQGSKKVEACSATNKDEYPKAVGFRGFLRDGLTAAGVDMIYVGSVQVVEGLAHEGHSAFTIDNLDSITSRWMMCFTPVRSMTR